MALVATVCLAEVLTMLGFSTFAALLPFFRETWVLSNTEAGWISAIFFAGYTLAVPVLVGLTDRVDPKRVYLLSAALAGAAGLGFAILAQGQIKKTSNSWLFLVFSYVGSLLAVFLFEFIYKRAMPSDEPPEEDEEDHHDSLLSPTNQ